MGEVVEVDFKKSRSDGVYSITVACGSEYYIHKADKITTPTLKSEEWEVIIGDEKITIPGSSSWEPIVIEGPKEIGLAIRHGIQPVRVTFERNPRTDFWWELEPAYLLPNSTETVHVVRFQNAIKHEYGK